MPLVHKLLFLLQGDILNNVQHFDVFYSMEEKIEFYRHKNAMIYRNT